ncbi:GntR family transcriptional regulator [Thalassobacillus hwangdonensis]|uniref:GntR family transcriptional regulator n=1 Tax=Thalassobacillus hwangdonensis TaxID=546108 RepID=A0ABW3L5W9_9BACI
MEFQSDKPIYQQVVDRIASEIVRGDRKPGDKLPSVREFAIEVGVNANTMQRVYREMEGQDLVETKRGQGTFVTNDPARIAALRETLKDAYIRSFVRDMNDLGISLDETVEGLQRFKGEEGEGND